MNFWTILLTALGVVAAGLWGYSWIKKIPYLEAVKSFLKWVWGILWGLIHDNLIKGTAKRKLIGWALSLGVGWIGLIFAGPPEIASAVNPMNYIKEFKRLSDELAQAGTQATREKQELMAAMRELYNSMSSDNRRLLDSLGVLKKKVTEISHASGSAEIAGGGEAKNGAFTDFWMRMMVKPLDVKTGKYWVDYVFNFDVKEVEVHYEEQDGKTNEVYSVWLESKKDKSVTRFLGDFKKARQVLIEPEADMRSWYWNDLAVNGDFIFGGRSLEGGISVSFFTWSSGGREPNALVARLPEIGAATNLLDHVYVFVGVRVNAGHWLPLFGDLYLVPKLGYGTEGKVIRLGLGTTL